MMTWSLFWLVLIFSFYLHLISALDTFPQFPEYKELFLNEHNEYRKRHHVPPLEWKSRTEIWKGDDDPGMNIWYAERKNMTLEDMFTADDANPVKKWYSQIKFYPHGEFPTWRSFTQLVWKKSKYLSCKVLEAYPPDPKRTNTKPPPTRHSIVSTATCYYQPPGNNEYIFGENIFKVDGTPWGKEFEETLKPGGSDTPNGSKDREELSTPGGSNTPNDSKDREELSTPGGSNTANDSKDREELSTPGGSNTANGSKDREELSTPGGSESPNGTKDPEKSSSHRIYSLDFLIITLLGVFLAVFI